MASFREHRARRANVVDEWNADCFLAQELARPHAVCPPMTKKILLFAMIGLTNTAVDVTVFFLLIGYVTSSLIAANLTAWVVAISSSYAMNSRTTFSVETGGKWNLKDYVGFVGGGIVAAVASTATLVVAAQLMPVWAAKLGSIAVSSAINFAIANFVVFRRNGDGANERRST